MLRSVAIGLAAILAFSASLAQVPSASPTDMQIMQARAQSAEAQATYFAMALQREKSDAAVLAKWWADYVAGLSP